MIISFFEEYPTPKNISKLKYITWPTKLYIAAHSLAEFNSIKRGIKSKWVKEVVYWPLLEKEEGYWFSPFSQRAALKRVFDEVKGKSIPVMIDAELPTHPNPSLYWKQLCNFSRNKKLIQQFVRNHKKIATAEYFPTKWTKEKLLTLLGLHFHPKFYYNIIIKMMYHSMHHRSKEEISERLRHGKQAWGSKFVPAFGTIAHGVLGNEPILSLEKLEQDLSLAQDNGIQEVIIFRLGGLNKIYAARVKQFT